ncbi:MAG: hypothetical protein V2J65_15390 [Desulfobacteraceae bacterium]|jgi:hypothetical protein|nr:hypothetical protein [Desulfobacteraceae bacterium]
MKQSLTGPRVFGIALFILTVTILIGCSGGEKIQSQISGTWQRTQGEGTVEINLANDPKSLKIGGQTYSATIDKVDKGSHSIHLKVETTAGQMEVWSLRQIWDDNGSSFKIAFNRNGTQETLEAVNPT